jgi:2-dehydropantoate 2-reductase
VHVLIVGAGAIGILTGHHLASAGHNVTFLGRPALAEMAARDGLRVIEQSGMQRVEARIVTVAEDIAEAPDVIIITVKAYDTAGAAAQIAPLAAGNTRILLIQNGVGGEAAGRDLLPAARWFGAVTTLVADRLEPTLVRQSKAKASLVIAPMTSGQDARGMVELFTGAGFSRVRAHPSYAAMKWSKLLLNILGNAAPAIVDMSPASTFANAELFAVERAAYLEALAVMRRSGIAPISLPGYPVPLLSWAMRTWPPRLSRALLSRLIVGGRGGKMPSLHKDLAGGRTKSEVEFLNGAVAAQGEKIGAPAPVNRALTETLLAIAGGEMPWERYRGNPQALWIACGKP